MKYFQPNIDNSELLYNTLDNQKQMQSSGKYIIQKEFYQYLFQLFDWPLYEILYWQIKTQLFRHVE